MRMNDLGRLLTSRGHSLSSKTWSFVDVYSAVSMPGLRDLRG
jgi:hypothetical protein